MINAKIKKNNENSEHEDTKTSFMFEMLLLLPDNLFCEILKEATGCNDFELAGKLSNYEFWPSWDVKDINRIHNNCRVEPDIFIQFENFDLIIEAKRSDDKGQYKEEWDKELTAYLHSKSVRQRKVVFVTVGGNIGVNTDEAHDLQNQQSTCKVHKTSWVKLLHYTKKITEDNNEPQIKRLVQLFEKGCNDIFSVRDFKWFDSLIKYKTIKQRLKLPMKDFKSIISNYANNVKFINDKTYGK